MAQFKRLPEQELKALYLRCDAQATQGLIQFGDAALCAMAYEVLLQNTFKGDFDALLAWWQGERQRNAVAQALPTAAAAAPAATTAATTQAPAAAGSAARAAPAADTQLHSASSGLESAFWKCDYSARQTTLTRRQAEICGAVIDGLRAQMFRGDMEGFMQWWEQNHEAQHRQLQQNDALQEAYPLP